MTEQVKVKKKNKLRHNEYYDMQSVFDNLYNQSKEKGEFKNLISQITDENNIKLAFRINYNQSSKEIYKFLRN